MITDCNNIPLLVLHSPAAAAGCLSVLSLLEELVIVVSRERRVCCLCELGLVPLLLCEIDMDLWGSHGHLLNKGEDCITRELSRQVEEGLFIVVVTLGRDLIVLEVLLPVKGDLLGLHLAVLDIDFVATEDDGDVLAHSGEVSMPSGHVLVGQAGGDVKHDDSTLPVDVVAITEATELLLTSCVPAIESDLAPVCGEVKGTNLHADRGLVFLLEFSSDVALNEGRLASTTVTCRREGQRESPWRSDRF